MPAQKDLKRIVRSRMKKTGESYTAARSHVLRKGEPRHPRRRPNYAERAGLVDDDKLKAKTGRDWAEWVRVLDAAGAREKPHIEIARHVASLGIPSWWSQTVTVGYERIHGRREIGQRSGGVYAASKSRTFAVPVAELYAAFANARRRKRWLPDRVAVRSSAENKRMRIAMPDGTLVEAGFTPKGAGKTAVAVEHTKLADRAAIAKSKAWWAERFDALAGVLGV